MKKQNSWEKEKNKHREIWDFLWINVVYSSREKIGIF